MQIEFIFSILVLVFSVVVHEFAHGYSAYKLGDNTAKFQGRLTLNPLKHLEWFGSFIVPTLAYMLGGFIIGWAKPVPYNPYNLNKKVWGLPVKAGEAIVAFSGPLSNILIALFFGLLIRTGVAGGFGEGFFYISSVITLINIVLAVFNMVPVPPLDGSKVLFSLLPYRYLYIRDFMERNSLFMLIFFIVFLWDMVLPIASLLFRLITGISY